VTVRWTTWLAITLWTITLLLSVCALAMIVGNGSAAQRLLWEGIGVGLTAIIALGTVGALLAVHRPTNPIGWILLVAALSGVLEGISAEYMLYISDTSPGALPEITPLFWLGAWTWIPAYFVLPTFGVLLFPTGRLPSRGWRPFAWAVGLWLAALSVAEMFMPGPLHEAGEFPQFTNPIAIESLERVFSVLVTYEEPAIVAAFGGTVMSIFVRLRLANAHERQQIKWFAYVTVVPLVGLGAYLILLATPGASETTANDVGGSIVLMGLAILPVTIGIAILRHNLYDIDRLINRTLVFGSLTAMLGAGFVCSVILLQFILSPMTGGSDLAVAGSTLLTAALFQPLRRRLQVFVDKRFYRSRYDAVRTLEAFNTRLRDEVDLDSLSGELCGVVQETMQPAHLSIWLRPRVVVHPLERAE
jgi:hypothetical protein